MTLLLDTGFFFFSNPGSQLFWVRDKSCTTSSCMSEDAVVKYDSSISSTYQPVSGIAPQSVTYGDGTRVACNVGSDDLTIGGLAIKSQRICFANIITTTTAQTDGLIGMRHNLIKVSLRLDLPEEQKLMFSGLY